MHGPLARVWCVHRINNQYRRKLSTQVLRDEVSIRLQALRSAGDTNLALLSHPVTPQLELSLKDLEIVVLSVSDLRGLDKRSLR